EEQCLGMLQPATFAAVDFHLPHHPINDPVFLNASAGIEFELGLLITIFFRLARRKDFDDQLRSDYEMTCLLSAALESFKADPDYIRNYVIIFGKDQSRRGYDYAEAALIVPFIEEA